MTGCNFRVVLEDGEPWFVLKDVCDVLGIRNPSDVKRNLNEPDKGLGSIYTPGGKQQVTVVNESGLYDVILDSRKPQAKRFRRWVTSEVLPSIRKDGGYIQGQEDMTGEELMLKAMEFAKSRIERLEREAETNWLSNVSLSPRLMREARNERIARAMSDREALTNRE
ncbi:MULTISPECIES: Bro-N domain-containing protein [Corynebacterium]|uniref:BRO-N domain-containing protein n=1 Tax=Corynebacterium TaxID=1716 RepID=UPI0021167D93|nr:MULTISPECIES: Bro-N domain-containing protein [Corynebacterium]MEB2596596.1 Bro-N domain-containing protein [Corynebacterium amycolatum]